MSSQGRSYGLPIDCLGNQVEMSNWQEILNDGAIYPQPLEEQNYNTTFLNASGISQVCAPGLGGNSGNRNGGLYHMDTPFMQQPLNSDDECWNSSWEQLLTLMKASPAVPENKMTNTSTLATHMQASIPKSNFQGKNKPISPPQVKIPYAGVSGIASRNVNVVDQHKMPSPYSQAGSNLMQSMMKATTTASHNKSLTAYGHAMPNACSVEGSYQMQPNSTSSLPLNPSSYQVSNQRSSTNSFSPRVQGQTYYSDGFPVQYKPHCNLNYKDFDSVSGMTKNSKFALATAQPTKKTQNLQYPAMLNVSLDRSLNQDKVQQETLLASRVTNSCQFAPATPQPSKMPENHQHSATVNLSLDQNQSQDRAQQETLSGSIANDSNKHGCQEIIQHIIDSSSAISGTSFLENNDSDNGENTKFNLSMTPPEITPKRKKHRPKVIVENKPPRNWKPAKAKTGRDVTPIPKRKYVRKNKSTATDTSHPDVVNKSKDTITEPSVKSCRRALNFEQEDNNIDKTKMVNQQERQYPMQIHICHNFNSQAGLHNVSNNGMGTNSVPLSSHQNVMIEGDREAEINSSLRPTIHQIQTENSLQLNHPMHGINPVMRELETEKLYMSTSLAPNKAIHLCKTTVNHYCKPADQLVSALGVGQTFFREVTAQEKLQRRRQQIMRLIAQKQQLRVSEYIQSRGHKRDYCLTEDHGGSGYSSNSINSQLLCKETFQRTYNGASSMLNQYFPEMHKRKKAENGFHTTSSSMPYSARSAGGGSSQVQINGYPVNHFLHVNRELFNSYHKSNNSNQPNGSLCYSTKEEHIQSTSPHANLLKLPISAEKNLGQEKQMRKEDEVLALSQVINFLNESADPIMQHQTPSMKASSRAERVATEIINRNNFATVSGKKDNGAPVLSNHMSNNSGSHEKQKNMVLLSGVIDQLECLNLNTSKNQTMNDVQNALVPYKNDGTIVPYKEFEPLKRQKPRPKVDLDSETSRLWKLLMEKDVSESERQTDQQKEKWWEEERKVFRGRADSFIARMHLVQGDRRFSPWKGSVVDSVIGVFLTQNVSDHLSSSAFMSLAASFPLQSIQRKSESANSKPSVLVKEPEISILETNDIIPIHEKFRNQAIYKRTLGESFDQQKHYPASVDGIQQSVKANDCRLEEIISSQDSTESFSFLGEDAVQSLSESDTKADHPINGSQSTSSHSSAHFTIEEMENVVRFPGSIIHKPGSSHNDSPTGSIIHKPGSSHNDSSANRHLHLQNAGAYNQEQGRANLRGFTTVMYPFDLNIPEQQVPISSSSNCQVPLIGGSGLNEVDNYIMPRKQHSNSLHLNASGVSRLEDMGVMRKSIGQEVHTETVLLLNRQTWAPESPTEIAHVDPNKHTADQKNSSQMEPQSYHHQSLSSDYQKERTMTSQFGSKSGKELLHRQIKRVGSAASALDLAGHASGVQKSISVEEKEVYLQNKGKSNFKEQDFSNSEAPRTKTKVAKEKGGKEAEKKTTFVWDSLRRQVQSNDNQRERSHNTMDSMDYEALRHADVNDIAKAIKERGMNNMLADRMKDFLNRLVRDHGSIDLEWLRDVPPDKAKDYLLSIRGLGLKSVECIRLLTLHQHAFPVDTNVGRIAVRLGWVPLQPLPESLQLHLLELYPVLESVQKYLWPRLCNLEQRTLYELHYQLITFGKVFCTKSKPNCNACPMRGECRHFASAFASSRLPLPGPEDKSIVTDVLIETSRIPALGTGQIPIYSLQEVPPKEGTSKHKCEPIVEEPTTPEPESTEISETDIEDMLYEDPDEIPTIRLNVEEFTQNLQNFMHENMELQEGDMSKALVALNPKSASIPTPKLKNVSRLRTEHQVYQLPDSHPLLKELDKREPDDPSPYLLAIWTPGETANSIHPPEWSCSSGESGKLCSDKTCFTCNSMMEANSQTVRGTLLIPCRTATRGSFPLNGTYFQVNEVFADHDSSLNPIDVPRAWIWNLPRRTVYFGTSASTIFKGMSTEEIQYCFWRGFVCVRGFDRQTRAPRPLMARLHFSASKQVKKTKREREKAQNN